MIGAVWRRLSGGNGSTDEITIPPMDGALKPNRRLEIADVELALPEPDNLAWDGERILVSSGKELLAVDPNGDRGAAILVEEFGSEITALAGENHGGFAVGLADGQIVAVDRMGVSEVLEAPNRRAPTAMVFDDHGDLLGCSGSQTNNPGQWKRDLMERNESGFVWKLNTRTGETKRLASGLAYPYGIAISPGTGELIVTESWKHRLLAFPANAAAGQAPRVVLDQLPGYPARIVANDTGYWLCVFAPRGQLIEFILSESEYRARMMASVHQDHWMAPSMSSGRSFLEPLQLGSVRTMGSLKPWAPTRSYGLLIRLDTEFQPTGSAHSRSDGNRHGVTSCVQWRSKLFVASKGSGQVLSLPADSLSED